MKTFLIAAITADGFIARSVEEFSLDWTSEEDTKFFRSRTRNIPVIMGATSYKILYKQRGRGMPNRLNIVYTKTPEEFENHDIMTTKKEPSALLKELEQKNYPEVAIIGGSTIYTLFLKARVIDKLYLTVEPVVFGKGIPLFSEPLDTRLRLVSDEKLNDNTILLEYDVYRT
jgi:dihydrofolate reductase